MFPRLLTLSLICLALGCHRSYVVKDPLTAEEIIALSRAGTPAEEINRKIDESRTIYVLDSQDIVNLHEQGVDVGVIEHMRKTREKARRDYYYDHRPYPYYHYPYYHPFYGYPYYGFGFSYYGYHCW